MPLHSLHDLLMRELSLLSSAEKQSLPVLERLQKCADNPRLARLLRSHGEETREQIARLDRIFLDLGTRPRNGATGGMRGLRQDCVEIAAMADVDPHARDAALIAAAQHLEHDEIAAYGCARTWAKLLGLRQVASLLQRSLDEEHGMDSRLSKLAESVNKVALEPELAA